MPGSQSWVTGIHKNGKGHETEAPLPLDQRLTWATGRQGRVRRPGISSRFILYVCTLFWALGRLSMDMRYPMFPSRTLNLGTTDEHDSSSVD